MSLESTLTHFGPSDTTAVEPVRLDASAKEAGLSFHLGLDAPSSVEDGVFGGVLVVAGLLCSHAVAWAMWPSMFALIS